jgi:hypothetical protein
LPAGFIKFSTRKFQAGSMPHANENMHKWGGGSLSGAHAGAGRRDNTGNQEVSMERKLHLLESFTARGSDGATYKVRGYEHLVRDESLADGREHWEPTGLAEYRLEDGHPVEVQRDGSMRIPHSGVQLARA